MSDEQFQIIEKLEEIRTQMAKLEEKKFEEYWYKEEELRHSLADLYYQRIHISRSWLDMCYMLHDFYRRAQYFKDVLDGETKRYDSYIEELLQMIETHRSNGDFFAAKALYDNELSEVLKQKKAMIEQIKADIENEEVALYDRIRTEINEISEQLEKNDLEISQIEKQLEEIQMKRSNDSKEIDNLKRNDAELSSSLLKEAERILKELKSRVSEPDDYLNNQ